jgi:hypothetical protein
MKSSQDVVPQPAGDGEQGRREDIVLEPEPEDCEASQRKELRAFRGPLFLGDEDDCRGVG